MYKLSNRSLSNISEIEDILIMIIQEGIKNSPYDFGIPSTGGFRTAEEQYLLFQKGASKCDGYEKKSYHQTGKAFDIYAYVDGKATWEAKYYEPIARHLQSIAKDKFGIELTWGGDWKKFVDMPHFQIK